MDIRRINSEIMSTKEKSKQEFKESKIKGLDKPLFISETKANYHQSVEILKKNHLRPLTYEEMSLVVENGQSTFINKNVEGGKSRNWFYTDGQGRADFSAAGSSGTRRYEWIDEVAPLVVGVKNGTSAESKRKTLKERVNDKKD
jgi:hypothetical protein